MMKCVCNLWASFAQNQEAGRQVIRGYYKWAMNVYIMYPSFSQTRINK